MSLIVLACIWDEIKDCLYRAHNLKFVRENKPAATIWNNEIKLPW